jgi:hypothetical protein
MSSLSFIVQWLLSSSLLVGAYLLARKAQKDTRLLPAAIVLFLFAVPIPIFASLFPGEDQLREFTSIKYGPPIAAFVESGIQQGPVTLPEGLSEKAGSKSSESQLKLGFQTSGSTGDDDSGPELGFGELQKNGTLMLNASTAGSQLLAEAPSPRGNSTEATEKESSSSSVVEEHGSHVRQADFLAYLSQMSSLFKCCNGKRHVCPTEKCGKNLPGALEVRSFLTSRVC